MKKIILVPLLLVCGIVYAQKLTGVQVDKPAVQTGQPIQAIVGLEGATANCGLRIEWGDGTKEDVKVDKPDQMPAKVSHTYAKAGDYTIKVLGTKVTSHLGCIGKDQTTAVKVTAPAAVAAAPAAAPAAVAAPAAKAMVSAGPSCPEGWKLNAKSVNKKTQAFSCTAKSGTAVPDKKIACPGDLGYFENSKKGQLGCRV